MFSVLHGQIKVLARDVYAGITCKGSVEKDEDVLTSAFANSLTHTLTMLSLSFALRVAAQKLQPA